MGRIAAAGCLLIAALSGCVYDPVTWAPVPPLASSADAKQTEMDKCRPLPIGYQLHKPYQMISGQWAVDIEGRTWIWTEEKRWVSGSDLRFCNARGSTFDANENGNICGQPTLAAPMPTPDPIRTPGAGDAHLGDDGKYRDEDGNIIGG